MRSKPVKYLVLIESSGAMVARMFNAERLQVAEVDATSEEVAVMTKGLSPAYGANDHAWASVLAGHSADERRAAQVFALDV